MLINEIIEDITKLSPGHKLDKLPHDEVESAIHRWVSQDDHIELSNGMHILSGENHGYADNVALIVDQDYKIIDHDDDIVDLMQQFTAKEIDPSIVETIVEKCWKGYKKKGMKTMFGKRVPNCVKNESNYGDPEKYDDTSDRDAYSKLKKVDDETDGVFANMPQQTDRDELEKILQQDKNKKQIKKLLDELPTRYRTVLAMRFGLNGSKEYTLEQVAKILGVTRERARQIEGKALRMLRHPSKSGSLDHAVGVSEDLRAWFGKGKKGGAGGGGWDRYNSKGERVGKCGDGKGKGKPKCLSKSAAAKLRNADKNKDGKKDGKAGIAKAVKRKQKNDPNKNRRGKAKNVKN